MMGQHSNLGWPLLIMCQSGGLSDGEKGEGGEHRFILESL